MSFCLIFSEMKIVIEDTSDSQKNSLKHVFSSGESINKPFDI